MKILSSRQLNKTQRKTLKVRVFFKQDFLEENLRQLISIKIKESNCTITFHAIFYDTIKTTKVNQATELASTYSFTT